MARQAENLGLPYDMYFNHTPEAYRREYPQFPFKVSEDMMFLYTADGQVEAYTGSNVMRQDLQLSTRIWSISHGPGTGKEMHVDEKEDVMALPNKGFVSLLSISDRAADSYLPILAAPEKPRILHSNPNGKISNVIPAYAASYGLELLDVIYANPKIYSLFEDDNILFGFSDEALLLEVDAPATSALELSAKSDLLPFVRNTGSNIYHFTMFDCVRQSALTPKPNVPQYADLIGDPIYQPMPWDGFVFDTMPVDELYTATHMRLWGYNGAETWGQSGGKRRWELPTLFNLPHTEEDIMLIERNVYESGMGIVLEECRRQYAAFLENKGWAAPAPTP